MQILAMSSMSNLNFGTVRVPMKDGTTAVLDVVRSTKNKADIVEISGNIMKQGKSVQKIFYHNKKGFKPERLAVIIESICKNAINIEQAITDIIMDRGKRP